MTVMSDSLPVERTKPDIGTGKPDFVLKTRIDHALHNVIYEPNLFERINRASLEKSANLVGVCDCDVRGFLKSAPHCPRPGDSP